MDPLQWLKLSSFRFHPFIAIWSRYMSKHVVPFITTALKELTGERTWRCYVKAAVGLGWFVVY